MEDTRYMDATFRSIRPGTDEYLPYYGTYVARVPDGDIVVDAEALALRGVANGAEVSVRALAFITAGHETHHLDIIRSRYLTQLQGQ